MPERRGTFSSPRSFTVRDLPESERPRERLQHLGPQALSSQELIAVLVGRGSTGHSVMTIAQELIARFGSLERIVNASVEELEATSGLGPAKALQLKACLEIARRVIREETDGERAHGSALAVGGAEDIARIIRSVVRTWQKEHCYVISLDTRNRVRGVDLLAVGTLTANLIHPRETFDAAIARKAAHIVLAHTHPSGDPTPSAADIEVTKRLTGAGKLMGIELLDHIIVCKTQEFSFRVGGLLG